MRVLENGYTVKDLGIDSINCLANLHKKSFTRGWGAHDFALFLQDNKMKVLGAFSNGDKNPNAFLLVRCVADEAEVISIAVGRRHRRKGVAEGMLDVAIDTLYDKGIKELHLEVDENNKGAVELYNQAGFEVIGERKAYYKSEKGEKASSALMMRLILDEE